MEAALWEELNVNKLLPLRLYIGLIRLSNGSPQWFVFIARRRRSGQFTALCCFGSGAHLWFQESRLVFGGLQFRTQLAVLVCELNNGGVIHYTFGYA